MSQPDPGEVERLFQKLQALLLQTWQDTGYGKIEVESTRIGDTKIRVVLKAGTYYCYTLRQEEVGRRPPH